MRLLTNMLWCLYCAMIFNPLTEYAWFWFPRNVKSRNWIHRKFNIYIKKLLYWIWVQQYYFHHWFNWIRWETAKDGLKDINVCTNWCTKRVRNERNRIIHKFNFLFVIQWLFRDTTKEKLFDTNEYGNFVQLCRYTTMMIVTEEVWFRQRARFLWWLLQWDHKCYADSDWERFKTMRNLFFRSFRWEF